MDDNICHCGQPLHYTDKNREFFIKECIDKLGRFVEVSVPLDGSTVTTKNSKMRTFKVDRHYIALHGIHGSTLADLGFEEIT